jgi:hypothetical protein
MCPAEQEPLIATDVPSWKLAWSLWCMALAYGAYVLGTGGSLDDDVALVALGVTVLLPLQAVYGSRRIEIQAGRLRVFRRGKVRFESDLNTLKRILHVPLTDAYWLWFSHARCVFIPANRRHWKLVLECCQEALRTRESGR